MITATALLNDVGVAVEGIDLSRPLERAVEEELRALWLEHGLLLLRGQCRTVAEQIRFSRTFGELEIHPLERIRHKDYPELIELNSADEQTNPTSSWDGEDWIGRLGWHTDLIYSGKPNLGAVLRAVILPANDGQTGYADRGAAYNALPDSMKEEIADLEIVYRFEVNLYRMPYLDTSGYLAGPGAPDKPSDVGFPDFPDSVYPLVVSHPVSGRKVLNVCPMFLSHIRGRREGGGDPLLQSLVDHVTDKRFSYHHSWERDDIILWDNWRMMHCAPGIRPGDERLIHRTTII
jgi:taurine dioxygenase